MATISKRGNTYRIRVSAGYAADGKQIMRSTTWKPAPGMTEKQAKKELERQAVLFEEKVLSGQYADSNIKFADYSDIWMKEYAEKQLRPKTIAQYVALLPRVNAAIGHIRLDRLQPQHLLSFYNMLESDGARLDTKYHSKVTDLAARIKKKARTKKAFAELSGVGESTLDAAISGKNVAAKTAENISSALGVPLGSLFLPDDKMTLSDKTVRHFHTLISSMLSTAVQWQIIASNPCERVKPKRSAHTEPKYLDEEQAAHLLELLDDESVSSQNRAMIQLLLFLGLRRGELLGLKWCDIDFDKKLIHIERSLQYLPGKGTFEDETKNSSSERIIKSSDFIIDVLKQVKKQQNELRLLNGDRWQDGGYIFTRDDGRPLHPDTLTAWFQKFVKENNLPDIHIHSLRHTNATLQIASGVPLTTVAGRLGHVNASTTTKIYAHAIKSADEAAAEAIQDILLKPTKKKQA